MRTVGSTLLAESLLCVQRRIGIDSAIEPVANTAT